MRASPAGSSAAESARRARCHSTLFESSLGAELQSLGTVELKRKLKRTRTLRDKSRDLLQRQKLATRARGGSKLGRSRSRANERSMKKAVTLDGALTRFEQTLQRREAADAKAKRQRPAAVVLRRALQKKQATEASPSEAGDGPKRRSKPADGGIETTPPDVRAEAVESRLQAANLPHIQGHTSAQVRKAQAKRDQRD